MTPEQEMLASLHAACLEMAAVCREMLDCQDSRVLGMNRHLQRASELMAGIRQDAPEPATA